METNLIKHYVFIDLENIQPDNLKILFDHPNPIKVFVFVGANQNKIAYDMVIAMQQLAENAEYIKISAIGSNALDFHIAFYIGQSSIQDPKAHFHIISKDKGYDPLIQHLKEKNIWIQRESNLTNIPILKKHHTPINNNEKIMTILKKLSSQKAKPKTVNSLMNSVDSFFGKKLNKEKVILLVNELQRRKYIEIEKNNVSYICHINQNNISKTS